MISRLRHYRAAFLLVISSASVFWVISYWFPFNDYLAVISGEQYKDYEFTIKTFVVVYLTFFLLNLGIAGLFASKVSSTLKFWLSIGSAAVLLLTPFLLTIPISAKFADRNYFEVFQALYRLFRFTKPDTFAWALIFSFIAVGLNIWAAIIVRRAGEVDKVSAKFRNRYLIYTAVIVVIAGAFSAVNLYVASVRSLDRQSCQNYERRALPQTDEEVNTFLSDVMLYGQSAGSKGVQDAFVSFAMISRQYYAALDSEIDDASLAALQQNVVQAKDTVALLCSEFATG